jgi:hypothetical protein
MAAIGAKTLSFARNSAASDNELGRLFAYFHISGAGKTALVRA